MQLNAKNVWPLGFIIIALSLAYYLVIFLPSKEKARQDLETKDRATKSMQEANKSQATQDCMYEIQQRVQNNEFNDSTIRSVGGAKQLVDLLTEICMKKKGYSN